MASIVPRPEAKSLSTINHLAANPPQYPNNPTQKGHESLTLYICRVPGTRDVILSTFRPQRKNVTGEDVTNSLYYVHLDHPDDELLVPPPPARSDDSATPASSVEIKRKPLPANARVATAATGRHGSETSERSPSPALALFLAKPAKDESVTGQREVKFLDAPTGIPHTSHSAPSSPRSCSSTPMPMRPPPNGPRPQEFRNFPPPHSTFDKMLSTSPAKSSLRSPSPSRMPWSATPPPDQTSLSSSSPSRPMKPSQRSQSPAAATTAEIPPTLLPRHPTTSVAAGSQPFSLTLIRRDPSTGVQWTVGKVKSRQNESSAEPTSPDNSHHHHAPGGARPISGHPFNIQIFTSGYAKFRDMPSSKSLETAHERLFTSAPQAKRQQVLPGGEEMVQGGEQQQQQQQQQRFAEGLAGEEGFHRQVRMSYSKGLRAGLKEKLAQHQQRRRGRHSSDAGVSASASASAADTGGGTKRRSPAKGRPISWVGGEETEPTRVAETSRHSHSRQDSVNSNVSATSSSSSSSDSTSTPSLLMHPAPGYRPAGYVFTSPWSGRCEFRTGNAGRSLKLRHVLAEPVVTAGDPVDPIMKQVLGPGAAPMSELRFNLPSVELFGGGRRGKIARDAQDKFARYVLQDPGLSSDEAEDDWEMEILTGVGREDAGGGNRGNRVKMGKLILHHEGIKAMDLVVSANVGVWWSAWERSS